MSNWKPGIGVTNLALVAIILLTACSAPGTTPVAQTGIGTTAATPAVAGAQNATQPAAVTPDPTYTPVPTFTPYPTYTPNPTSTPLPTATPPAPTPTAIPIATEISVPAEAPTALPIPTTSAGTSASGTVELRRIPDTDPAPPLTILVDVIRIKQDGHYMITGWVRNDGSEIYEAVGVRASFLDDEGRGYGAVDVYCPCPFLEPGAECPFSLEAYPHSYEAYRLHARGQPVVYRRPAPLAVSAVHLSDDGIGNVRITGTVVNENGFTVAEATVAGALMDDGGRVVGVGWTLVLGDILPGDSKPFELLVQYEPYARYQLYASATPSRQ